MKPLKFDIKSNGKLNEYLLGTPYDKWLDKTVLDNKTLYDKLLNGYDNQDSDWHTLFNNLAYYNCTHEENIFLYEKLIWELIKGKFIYVIINFNTPYFLSQNDLPFDKIDWEYSIEYQVNFDTKDATFLDNGFVKARTGWIKPPTPKWKNSEKDKTALFEIHDFKTFIDVILTIALDDYGSINIFCLEEDRKDDLVSKLRKSKKPKLTEILTEKDLFIALLLGGEVDYYDYILVKSFSDLEPKLTELTKRLNEGGKFYEENVEELNNFKELVELIEKCFGLKISTDNNMYKQ